MEKREREKLEILVKKLESSKCQELSLKLGNIRLYQYILFKNYGELINIIEVYEKEYAEGREDILSEYSRLFFNYLSSVYSLITVSQHFRDDLKNPKFTKEYQKQIDYIQDIGCGAFVKELRHAMIHGKFFPITPIPDITSRITYFKRPLFKRDLRYVLHHPKILFNLRKVFSYIQRIFLQKSSIFDVFIKFKITIGLEKQFVEYRMQGPAKKFMEKFGTLINLKEVITEYQELIMDFYEWLYGTIAELYSKEIKEYRGIEAEINRLIRT